jgi:hypothetical protein
MGWPKAGKVAEILATLAPASQDHSISDWEIAGSESVERRLEGRKNIPPSKRSDEKLSMAVNSVKKTVQDKNVKQKEGKICISG